LALFFDRISRFSRIINIEDLNISALPGPKGTHTLAASFNAKTFVYKESEPPPPAPAGGPAAAAGAGPAALQAAGARAGGGIE
ncbi:MAG TPA: type 4a pilus biogenesis protein PilO, partial [Thermoanaerobaculia bacterium]|nr:type 4a pilus biogenesis protein PilO [Thermoanaerobaculia bacterium]